MVTTHQIVLAERPQGAVTPANFRAEDAPLPPIGDGPFLVGANYLSPDPYMRGRMDDWKSYAEPTPAGGVKAGEIIGTVMGPRNQAHSVPRGDARGRERG